ncbi:MAG: 3-oxoacyl-ACP synthase [Bacteriovorax sp.]|nr:3-oxoacyl-ACP synthase [Bacteriovorax sp.]
MNSIVLKKAAVWLPEGFEDSTYIANESGVPEHVIRTKMGIVRKCRASKDMHPGEMAVRAARSVLKDIDPLSIDMVIWTGSEYKDYIVWTAGIYVQRELGLKNAKSFDISARCSNKILGLHIAKSLMQTDPKLKRVLLCGGHKTGDLVNYKDPNTRFLYNLADGGSAILLERGEDNPLLDSSLITDGDFTTDVIVPAGGTKHPTRENPDVSMTYLQVPDVDGMRERLEKRSIVNFLKVINEAADNSLKKPIDYLALLHMKKSAHDAILAPLELKQSQSIYMDHYGHFGAPDQVLSLGLAEKRGLLKKGDHIVLASAGIGYMWSAMALRWDAPTFDTNDLIDLG